MECPPLTTLRTSAWKTSRAQHEQGTNADPVPRRRAHQPTGARSITAAAEGSAAPFTEGDAELNEPQASRCIGRAAMIAAKNRGTAGYSDGNRESSLRFGTAPVLGRLPWGQRHFGAAPARATDARRG